MEQTEVRRRIRAPRPTVWLAAILVLIAVPFGLRSLSSEPGPIGAALANPGTLTLAVTGSSPTGCATTGTVTVDVANPAAGIAVRAYVAVTLTEGVEVVAAPTDGTWNAAERKWDLATMSPGTSARLTLTLGPISRPTDVVATLVGVLEDAVTLTPSSEQGLRSLELVAPVTTIDAAAATDRPAFFIVNATPGSCETDGVEAEIEVTAIEGPIDGLRVNPLAWRIPAGSPSTRVFDVVVEPVDGRYLVQALAADGTASEPVEIVVEGRDDDGGDDDDDDGTAEPALAVADVFAPGACAGPRRIVVTATNVGDAAGAFDVAIEITRGRLVDEDDGPVSVRTPPLAPGEETAIELVVDADPGQAATVTAIAGGPDGPVSAAVTVEEQPLDPQLVATVRGQDASFAATISRPPCATTVGTIAERGSDRLTFVADAWQIPAIDGPDVDDDGDADPLTYRFEATYESRDADETVRVEFSALDERSRAEVELTGTPPAGPPDITGIRTELARCASSATVSFSVVSAGSDLRVTVDRTTVTADSSGRYRHTVAVPLETAGAVATIRVRARNGTDSAPARITRPGTTGARLELSPATQTIDTGDSALVFGTVTQRPCTSGALRLDVTDPDAVASPTEHTITGVNDGAADSGAYAWRIDLEQSASAIIVDGRGAPVSNEVRVTVSPPLLPEVRVSVTAEPDDLPPAECVGSGRATVTAVNDGAGAADGSIMLTATDGTVFVVAGGELDRIEWVVDALPALARQDLPVVVRGPAGQTATLTAVWNGDGSDASADAELTFASDLGPGLELTFTNADPADEGRDDGGGDEVTDDGAAEADDGGTAVTRGRLTLTNADDTRLEYRLTLSPSGGPFEMDATEVDPADARSGSIEAGDTVTWEVAHRGDRAVTATVVDRCGRETTTTVPAPDGGTDDDDADTDDGDDGDTEDGDDDDTDDEDDDADDGDDDADDGDDDGPPPEPTPSNDILVLLIDQQNLTDYARLADVGCDALAGLEPDTPDGDEPAAADDGSEPRRYVLVLCNLKPETERVVQVTLGIDGDGQVSPTDSPDECTQPARGDRIRCTNLALTGRTSIPFEVVGAADSDYLVTGSVTSRTSDDPVDEQDEEFIAAVTLDPSTGDAVAVAGSVDDDGGRGDWPWFLAAAAIGAVALAWLAPGRRQTEGPS